MTHPGHRRHLSEVINIGHRRTPSDGLAAIISPPSSPPSSSPTTSTQQPKPPNEVAVVRAPGGGLRERAITTSAGRVARVRAEWEARSLEPSSILRTRGRSSSHAPFSGMPLLQDTDDRPRTRTIVPVPRVNATTVAEMQWLTEEVARQRQSAESALIELNATQSTLEAILIASDESQQLAAADASTARREAIDARAACGVAESASSHSRRLLHEANTRLAAEICARSNAEAQVGILKAELESSRRIAQVEGRKLAREQQMVQWLSHQLLSARSTEATALRQAKDSHDALMASQVALSAAERVANERTPLHPPKAQPRTVKSNDTVEDWTRDFESSPKGPKGSSGDVQKQSLLWDRPAPGLEARPVSLLDLYGTLQGSQSNPSSGLLLQALAGGGQDSGTAIWSPLPRDEPEAIDSPRVDLDLEEAMVGNAPVTVTNDSDSAQEAFRKYVAAQAKAVAEGRSRMKSRKIAVRRVGTWGGTDAPRWDEEEEEEKKDDNITEDEAAVLAILNSG